MPTTICHGLTKKNQNELIELSKVLNPLAFSGVSVCDEIPF
jgi:hypothetical protein